MGWRRGGGWRGQGRRTSEAWRDPQPATGFECGGVFLMSVPTDRKYAETHEWFLDEGDVVTVGITQHAADELTDITFVQLPELGTRVGVGDAIGEVESVKATSEIFTAVSGKIVEINEALVDHPELINDSAFDDGWIAKIKADSGGPLADLMDGEAYDSFLEDD
jgi:glycine cleavage system H protein